MTGFKDLPDELALQVIKTLWRDLTPNEMLPVLQCCKHWFSLAFPQIKSHQICLRPQQQKELEMNLLFDQFLPRSDSFFAYVKSFELQVVDMVFLDAEYRRSLAFHEIDLTPLIKCLPLMKYVQTFQLRFEEFPNGNTWVRQADIAALLAAMPTSIVNLHIDTSKRDFPNQAASNNIRLILQARKTAFHCLKVRLARFNADIRASERKQYKRTENVFYYMNYEEATKRDIPVFEPLRTRLEGQRRPMRPDVSHHALELGEKPCHYTGRELLHMI